MFDDDISRVTVYFCLKLVYDYIVDCVLSKKSLNCFCERISKKRDLFEIFYIYPFVINNLSFAKNDA